MALILLVGAVIIAIVVCHKYKKKKEADARQQEIEDNLEEMRLLAMSAHKSILRAIGGKFLNHKLYQKLKHKHQDTYEALTGYEDYLYEDCFLIFDFFQTRGFRNQHNKEYVADCKDSYEQYFKDIDDNGHGLTHRQLEAVFSDEDATLVNAGAGTGKTKTIESKLLHLIAHREIPIDDILVMTFSKKSQEDMMQRIKGSLKKAGLEFNNDSLKDTISTFHAFGKKILDEECFLNQEDMGTKKIGKGGKMLGVLGDRKGRQIIHKVFDVIKKKSITQKLIADFILFYSAPQVSVEKFNNLNEYYKYTKRTNRTLLKDGEYNITVKSYGEFLIANYLRLHNIEVQYEPRGHYYTNYQGYKKQYRPDFYLPEHDIYIEYFGVDKDGRTAPYISNREYIRRVDQKITAHEESGNKLVDIRYADLQGGRQEEFIAKLQNELEYYGVQFNPRSSDEVIEMKEVSGQLDGIAKILNTFLHLYKESSTTIPELKKKVGGSFDVLNLARNIIFLKIFEAFEEEYSNMLEEEGYMDFGDMIYRSVDLISNNIVKRKYKYILVDEFQDISQARARLLQDVIAQNKDCRLFCVGDDRQSIYQFSGSDTDIFFNFDQYFGYTKKITLDRTFRFNQGISDLSGGFIMMNPEQERKNLKSSKQIYKGRVQIHQKDKQDASYFFSILQDIVDDSPYEEVINVFLITRYTAGKYGDGFFEMLKKDYKHKKVKDSVGENRGDIFEFIFEDQRVIVTHTTSHKSKGLEADYVIVDYVNQNDKYNFPSSFEDDPVLVIITKDRNDGYLFAEERRIFYVSMTRGKKKSYVVYTTGKQSAFLEDIVRVNSEQHENILEIVSGDSESTIMEIANLPDCPDCGGKLSIRTNTSTGEDFWGCSNYPLCTHIMSIEDKDAPKCPRCKKKMKLRNNKNTGEEFRGCTNYPECRGTREID